MYDSSTSLINLIEAGFQTEYKVAFEMLGIKLIINYFTAYLLLIIDIESLLNTLGIYSLRSTNIGKQRLYYLVTKYENFRES